MNRSCAGNGAVPTREDENQVLRVWGLKMRRENGSKGVGVCVLNVLVGGAGSSRGVK